MTEKQIELAAMIIGASVALLVLFVVGYAHYKVEKARREALRAWASARGLSFSKGRNRSLKYAHPSFSYLSRGSNEYAYNIIAGTLQGFDAWLFDYHYQTYSGGRRPRVHHHHFSAVILNSPFPLLPITIRPEGTWDQLAAAFGWDDIDFESAEFSRRYHVTAEDRRWAFDVIHGEVMQRLVKTSGFAIEGDRRSMICWAGRRLELSRFEEAFGILSAMLDGIPQHARERVGHRE